MFEEFGGKLNQRRSRRQCGYGGMDNDLNDIVWILFGGLGF